MLRAFTARLPTFARPSLSHHARPLVTRGGKAISSTDLGKADPYFIDSAVNTVAGEVTIDQLEPHELARMRADREKQLDIRNFTLNFGPQHPGKRQLNVSERYTNSSALYTTNN
ncbi:hypothetical protein BWQ96_09038 [Gracilariopsis chorda]|uniref:Uncharacterized protein n=1 Tax=Gracilariopsis chorda TaxID=448386 RepID=A0A2V3IGW2_9FLOR|nr:hypothetical protein BWQ96_09038 [Gracilariopsis chorda]|eukprot:PXF41278.1 hypothetical protein BWQ96_09038 [Gracilariopsis chorda]